MRNPQMPQRISSTANAARVCTVLICDFHSAKGTLEDDIATASGTLTDSDNSKTFLARLCEQAERYDGTSPAPDLWCDTG